MEVLLGTKHKNSFFFKFNSIKLKMYNLDNDYF